MSDPEAILDALAGGMSVPKAARHFDVLEVEVREILKAEVERCRDGAHLREVWVLADRRLAAVEHKFYQKAIEGDGDPQSAIVFVKTNERRSALGGHNMPQNHVLQVVSQPPEAVSSTTQIEAALDCIRGVTPRERELQDKQLYSSELTIDEQAELAQLQAEREAKRITKLSQDQPSTKPH